jgi:low molecular weight protein-tyrosine phosphatase
MPETERPVIEGHRLYNVLMVCTGNICRSPMAAGLLGHHLPSAMKARIAVASAGTHALHGHQAQEDAVAAMHRRGIAIGGHRARQLTRDIARGADLILTMEALQLITVKRLLGWGHNKSCLISAFNPQGPQADIEDPYGEPPEAYEACIQVLQPCIWGVIGWLEKELSEAGPRR